MTDDFRRRLCAALDLGEDETEPMILMRAKAAGNCYRHLALTRSDCEGWESTLRWLVDWHRTRPELELGTGLTGSSRRIKRDVEDTDDQSRN